ncbi:MAG: Fe-Mn family superoxide dismutase [bacterium]|nr:Fe-Mn family superoxide dismutase [bacterium]
MSAEMLKTHTELYDGYVAKTNEIQKKVDEADKSKANQSFSEFGELKRQETFSVNGMKLHEIYFNHLKKGGSELSGPLKEMIEKDYGSVEAWKEEMVATGIASRGWAILAFDWQDMRLHIYGQDAHNVGAVWGASPLIALDVYEHAYFLDYGKGRGEYIDAFFANMDYDAVNEVISKWKINEMHAV